MAKDEKDACYQILSFGLWRNLVVYNIRLLLAKKFIFELFWRAKYSTIKRRVAYWRNIVIEEYVEVKKKKKIYIYIYIERERERFLRKSMKAFL